MYTTGNLLSALWCGRIHFAIQKVETNIVKQLYSKKKPPQNPIISCKWISINLTEALKKKEEEKRQEGEHSSKILIVSQLEVLGYFSKEWVGVR